MKKKLKPWQKTAISYVSFLLVVLIAVAAFLNLAKSPKVQYGIAGGIIRHSEAGENITDSIINNTENTTVLENENLRFDIKPDGNIAVTNKATGKVWSSSVEDALVSNFSQGYGETHSLCSITYVNEQNAEAVWTSYDQCIKKKQMHIYRMSDDTIRFDLILGESSADQMIPTGITKERFENDILPNLDEDDQAFLKRQYLLYEADKLTVEDNPDELYKKYPKLKDTPIYIAGNIEAKITKQKLTKVFEKIGYTAEDYEKDNQLTGYGATTVTFTYKLCIDYTLQGNELVVNIPKDEIVFYTAHPLLRVSLMKFLTSATDSASVLIPSGSGAIAQFVPGGEQIKFSDKVYGEDLTVNQKTLPSVMDNDSALSFPMFAMRYGNDTVTAVIESGQASASLNYNTTASGMNCYYEFTVLQSDRAYIDEKNSVIQCGNDVANQDITVRYSFGQAGANHSDEQVFSKLSCDYREYLKAKDMLSVSDALSSEPTLLLDIVGSINVKKDLLGLFPVTENLVLTDFKSAQKMVDWFSDKSDINLKVKLSGWNDGGLYRQSPGKVSFSGALGGKKGYKSFMGFLEEKGIDSYYSAEHITFLNPELFSGIKKSDNALFIDGSVAQLGVYSAVEGSNFGEGKLNVITPEIYESVAKKYAGSDIDSISIGRLANSLNSDYDVPYFDRTRTESQVIKALKVYSEKDITVSAEDANLYAMKYCDFIENMPTKSGESTAFTQSFPLKQIVLHGAVDYATEIDFSVSEAETAVLNAIRAGSGLKCTLSYKNSDYSFPSYYSFMYSTDYNNNRDAVVKYGNKVNEALKGLGNTAIIAYETDGEVSKTVYENGTVIYVNTGDTDEEYDTQKIEAKSYLRIDK